MSEKAKVNRRDFFRSGISAGAGLMLAFHLPALGLQSGTSSTVKAAENFSPNAYLSIHPDNKITVWVTRMEMGQGVRTTLPMLLADELEVDLLRIEIKQASTIPQFKGIRLRTSGSGSMAGTWAPLRRSGAAAREMLITAAAQKWNVEASTCRAENGAVIHIPTDRRLTYGELVEIAAILPVPTNPKVKDAEDFRYIGKATKRLDAPQMVVGSVVYGSDIKVPGMRYAVIARSPVLGGKALRWDASKAKSVVGVRAIVPVTTGLTSGVAVVADSTWAALKGREALNVIWDEGQHKNFSSVAFTQQLRSALDQTGYTTRKEGDFAQALANAATKIEAVYEYPFQAHAPLEPMNCIADVQKDGCEIWVGTQAPERAQEEVAKMLGIATEAVKINVPLMGGGFGRRLFVDYVPEAVEISRAISEPVQVVWTRADDTKHGFFHPATVCQMTAGLNAERRPVAWKHKTISSDLSVIGPPMRDTARYTQIYTPWGAYDNPYLFPAIEAEYVHVDSPVPSGPWRAVGYPQNIFARECFVDEVAHACGKDPLGFRIELLSATPDVVKVGMLELDRKKIRDVLDLAAEKSYWTKPLQQANDRRWGRGIACNIYHGETVIAQVAEVSVGNKGDVKVHRIVCAVDCGVVVNPLGLEGQIESGIVWGLSAVLHGRITFKHGQAEQSSYRDFQVLRMSDMPRVETHVIPGGTRPFGIGEQPVPTVAPAVLNAVFAATGKRLRRLPIDTEELRRG